MEYPMATLLKGAGPELMIHEWMHSWYQGVIANNESLYPWMDEGFADYAEARVMSYLTRDTGFAYRGNYASYVQLAKSNKEEPLSTHADHFNLNYAHTTSAYSKGAIFVEQLGYITGAKTRDKILLDYYQQWKFRHPTPHDLVRIAEKNSGMKLDWYRQYWINTVKTIDYAIDSLWEQGGKTRIRLQRLGEVPMPIDVKLTFKDGTSELHYIPLDLMYGAKTAEDPSLSHIQYKPWLMTPSGSMFTTYMKSYMSPTVWKPSINSLAVSSNRWLSIRVLNNIPRKWYCGVSIDQLFSSSIK